MTRAGRIAVLARYTVVGGWRRWLFFAPAAIVLLLFLLSAPRIAGLAARSGAAGPDFEALGDWADFSRKMFGNVVVLGGVLALALGASSVGSRRLGVHVLPLLARPVSRAEFVAARFVGSSTVLIALWVVLIAVRELVGAWLGLRVGIAPATLVLPLLLQLELLALGMAIGTVLPPLAATFAGIAAVWGVAAASVAARSETAWLAAAGRTAGWILPPFPELLDRAGAFVSSADVLAEALLVVQAAAWIGLFLAVARHRFERLDLTARAV